VWILIRLRVAGPAVKNLLRPCTSSHRLQVPASGQSFWNEAGVCGAHPTLATATETIDVHMGPAARLDAKNVTIASGDTVTISRSAAT
jgi:hypothetical protein